MACASRTGAVFEPLSRGLAHRGHDPRRFLACALLAAATSTAAAEPSSTSSVPSLRSAVVEHFAAETESVRAAIAAVDQKLRDGDVVRARRLMMLARLVRAHVAPTATAEQQLSAVRRTAAARFVLTHDAAERRLLLDELAQLRTDATRIAIAALQAPTVPLPTHLSRPARGTIGRRFGPYIHTRTAATLPHRGIDFVVKPRAPIVSPADGIVRFDGSIRGLDRGVIIDHGNFFTVVAKLGDVSVPVGTRVGEGDRVGHAADGHVYLEVRVKLGPGGLPIDPEPLLAPLDALERR